jgi:RNase P protein component
MSRAVDTPEWHRQNHQFLLWGYEYIVVAKLKDVDYTFWQLKWGLTVDTN